MTYLLNTDTCVYWLNGKASVRTRLLDIGWDQVAISVITQAELYYGAYKSTRTERNLTRVDTLVEYLQIIPLDEDVLKRFGALMTEYREQGESFALMIKIYNELSTWLIRHILVVDTELRAYVNQ